MKLANKLLIAATGVAMLAASGCGSSGSSDEGTAGRTPPKIAMQKSLGQGEGKVNLIVWNPGPGIAYTQPRPEDVAAFQKMLIDAGMSTYIRRPRGRDIYAACGQLKRTVDSPGATPAAPLIEIAPAATLPS